METIQLLLPASIQERLSTRTDLDGILPLNLSSPMIRQILDDAKRRKRAEQSARVIWHHLESGGPGWGEWPSDISEALVVGLLLGFEVGRQAGKLVLDLPSEDLSFVEDQCREQGISLEQYLIAQIVEDRENQ
jgi:hypothetical protein